MLQVHWRTSTGPVTPPGGSFWGSDIQIDLKVNRLDRWVGERALQAEGAPLGESSFKISLRAAKSINASETKNVLASAVDRGNCSQLVVGRQPWVTQQKATRLVNAAEVSQPSVFGSICSWWTESSPCTFQNNSSHLPSPVPLWPSAPSYYHSR